MSLETLNLDTKPLLRPHQQAAFQEERAALEEKMHSPHIQDKAEVGKQIRRLDTALKTQTAKPFVGKEIDEAIRLEVELRERILQGMPSQEEMRKNPHGAVDKHIAWEKRNKSNIELWKNCKLRLNPGSEDRDLCNFEKYRPTKNSLNMDSTQIAGTNYFLPPDGAGLPVRFSDAQIELLRELAPEVAERLSLLSNDQRREVKQALAQSAVSEI